MFKTTLTEIMKDNQHLKTKYYVTQATFVILQLFDSVCDVTVDFASVMAVHFCGKFFTSEFQV